MTSRSTDHRPAADRSKGGPGSSHETAEKPGSEVAGAHHQNRPTPHEPAEADTRGHAAQSERPKTHEHGSGPKPD